MNSIPKWIKGRLKPEELQSIEAEVATVEKMVSVEIVPMIVKKSVATGHVRWLVFLFLMLLVVSSEFLVLQSSWFGEYFHPAVWVVVDMGALFFVAYALGEIDWVQRALTSRQDRHQQVWRRAQSEFFANKIQNTEKRNGILLMASLLERHAVVITDETILKVLPQQTWGQTISLLVQKAAKGHLGDGFVDALKELKVQLKPHFKKVEDSTNEIPNRFIIKE